MMDFAKQDDDRWFELAQSAQAWLVSLLEFVAVALVAMIRNDSRDDLESAFDPDCVWEGRDRDFAWLFQQRRLNG